MLQEQNTREYQNLHPISGQSVSLPMITPASTSLLTGGQQGISGDLLEASLLTGGQGRPGDLLFYSQDGNQVKVAQVKRIVFFWYYKVGMFSTYFQKRYFKT